MSVYWSTPVWMWPLLLVVAAGAVLWAVQAYRQTRPEPGPGLRRTLTRLRAVTFLLLVLALAGPVLSRLLVRERPAEIAIVLEDSGSMAIADAGPDSAATRWRRALRLAAMADSVLAGLEQPVRPIFLRGNGQQGLVEFAPDDPVVASPAAHGTDLSALPVQVADRLAGRPVRGVVLLSDGQETVTGPAGTRRGTAGGHLFVVGVGNAAGPADRLVTDLRYPDTAYAGDEIVVEFAVAHRFWDGTADRARELSARIVGPGGVLADTTLVAESDFVPLELSFRPSEPGLQTFELVVDALDNERFRANNRASLAVNVRQERARLLMITPLPGWDTRFLAQAAAQEQRLALTVVQPSARGLVLADSLVAWQPPTTAEEWLAWDAVILPGWNGALGSLDWEPLSEAVERGLGLLVLPGATPTPGGAPNPFAPPVGLQALLPVTITSWRWSPGPHFVAVAGEGAGHPVLAGVQAAGRGADDDIGLGDLPPLDAVPDVTADPAAEVLLAAAGRETMAEARRLPILVVQPRGQGRVAWFGGRRLWELTFWEDARGDGAAESPAAHAGRRLVRNLLVWAAAGLEESGLVFTGRQSLFQSGEPIRLGAQWRDMRGQAVTDRTLEVVLRTNDGAPGTDRTFALRSAPGRLGVSEVQLPPLPPGRYTVQLQGEGEPPVLGPVEDLVVVAYSVEDTQIRMDRRRLVQLAARGGGRFYDGGDAAETARLLEDLAGLTWAGDEVTERRRLDVRLGWPLLVLVALLLGFEWYLRRRHGLL